MTVRSISDAQSVPMRLINVFNVPPEADEAFMADWERVRESLAALDAPVVRLEPDRLANVNTPAELAALLSRSV